MPLMPSPRDTEHFLLGTSPLGARVIPHVAMPKLRKRRRIEDAESATPLAIGYWGKPPTLEGAKFDFLCIHATLRSLKPDGPTFKEVFMVDSGSDVVTARQEILNRLDLELIGTIQSRGVHTTVEKQLYKAMLVIGNHEVEIEIMAEPYESIGNRVMRHFRHVIDSTVHYWLPENRLEPSEGMTASSRSDPNTSGESGETSGTPESDEEKAEEEEEDENDEEDEEENDGGASPGDVVDEGDEEEEEGEGGVENGAQEAVGNQGDP
ncbi:acidic leucine-rich nuclear phosphoprotein 32 family member E-like [Lytechinus pictus]|uniref:acidic leucine-rich nuclear phosphoprotein 32 family member E-like n=1 Tax=Lytechinus pictus TaxID=7653 RepID=UPI0030B9FA02